MYYFRLFLITVVIYCSTPHVALASRISHLRAVHSNTPAVQTVKLPCEAKLCTFTLPALSGRTAKALSASTLFAIETVADNIVWEDVYTLLLSDTLSIRTPLGIIQLFDADLKLTLTSEQRIERFHGMAQIPLPSFGILDNEATLAPTLAEVGLENGSELLHLNAELVPSRPYFYVHLQTTATTTNGDGTEERSLSKKLAIPAGQSLTIIVDLVHPLLYIDGNIALQNLSQLTLLNRLIGATTNLPFRFIEESVRMHITGQISDRPDDTFLRMDGYYRIDPQFLTYWFDNTTETNQVYGSVTIGAEGVLFLGDIETVLFTEQLLSGSTVLEIFIPFGDSTDGYADLNTTVEIPMWEAAQSQIADKALQSASFSALRQPLQALRDSTNPMFLMLKDGSTDTILYAARGYQMAKSTLTQGYQWSVDIVTNTANRSADLASNGYQSSRDFAADNSIWLLNQAKFQMAEANGLLSNTYITATHFSSSSYQQLKEGLLDGINFTTEGAKANYQIAKDAVQEGFNSVTETTKDGYDLVTETATNSYEATKETISATYGQTSNLINDSFVDVSDTISESYESASGLLDDGLEQVQCVTANTQSLWCRTTGLCEPVACEP